LLIVPLIILSAGCARADRSGGTTDGCTPTQSIQAPAPQNTDGGPTDASTASWHSWYVNADRSIWMFQFPMVARERNKIAWFRPDGVDLSVTGRRIDAPAPPLSVDITPAAYRYQFCPSILIFPTDGCWEITARTPQSEARFVVRVQAATGGEATTQPHSN
jgi:hypothetical protein